jgi:CRP-like cAMP-binding protein
MSTMIEKEIEMTIAPRALRLATPGSGAGAPGARARSGLRPNEDIARSAPGAARRYILNTALAERTTVFREENRLLAALPESDYRRLLSHMEFVRLPSGRVLFEVGETVTHAYFPATSAISLMTQLENGASTGIALVGNESLIGVSLILEGKKAICPVYRAVVQNAGYAYRIRAESLLQEFQRGSALQRLLLGAAQAQITQIGQFAACNRFHTLPKRLCSWLLHSIDRLSGDELYVTQRVLSTVLGVRREGVTDAERRLRCAGVIEYTRGHIHVADRSALEQRACECYSVIAREYARLSPAVAAPPANYLPN